MAKLIVKSPYLRSGAGAGGYMKYIATRENVELLPDSRPVTAKQRQLIDHILEDFPDAKDLPEYEQMALTPSVATASCFLSAALDDHKAEDSDHSDIYLRYIATRPHVEKQGSHGLFGDEPKVDLPKAMAELEQYPGKVWTHILSLTREDAARLCYDNAESWRNLLKCHRNDIADAMGIPPKNFRWYAAFHNEGDHPHVHMMAWSADPKQGYLGKDGIRQIKSVLTRDIFHQEMLCLFQEKSQTRDQLIQLARENVRELAQEMKQYLCDSPEAESLMQTLSRQLDTVKGKKVYGYLPRDVKKTVDAMMDELGNHADVEECYQAWWEIQCQIREYYGGAALDRPPLSQQKELRAIKNAIIREADALRHAAPVIEDIPLSREPEIAPGAPAQQPQPVQWEPVYKEVWPTLQKPTAPPEEHQRAVSCLQNQCEQQGDLYWAGFLLGKVYRDGMVDVADPERAKQWFRRSAEAGNPHAAYALGKLLLESVQPERALPWLRQAARAGHNFALYRLGYLYMEGTLVPKDTIQAIRYWKDSAAAGNACAQFALGRMYLMGTEVPRDYAQGCDHLQQAADYGHPYAQPYLDAAMYRTDPSLMVAVTRSLYHLSRVFEDTSRSPALTSQHMDRKHKQELMERREALGIKGDPEEYLDQGMQFSGY